MQTVENYVDMDFYEEIWKAAVDRFVKKCDYEKLIKIYEGDQLITSYTIEKITKACDGLEYSAFELLDNLVNNIEDGDLKEQLLDYSSKNEFNRVRSFLLGSWEWESDADTDTQVKVHSYQDNILAEVTQVGENEIEYQLMVGDIYWKDLVLLGDGSFTCTNLCKTTDAIVVECTALVKIDYDNNILNFHLTAPEPYIMVNPDRTWIRL